MVPKTQAPLGGVRISAFSALLDCRNVDYDYETPDRKI
jgi:hypothetical protein